MRTAVVLLVFGAVLAGPAVPALAATQHPYNLGCKALAQGDVGQAKTLFQEALKLDGSDTDALNNLAVCYIMEHDYDQALPLLQKVLRLNKHYSGADLNTGAAYMFQGEQGLAQAVAPTTRATDAGNTPVGQRVRAAAYCNLGLIAMSAGHYADARAAFEESVAAGDSVQAQLGLACSLCALGQGEQGVPMLEKLSQPAVGGDLAKTANADLAIAYYQRGLTRLARGDLEGAEADFKKSNGIAANDYAQMGLAMVAAERGDYRAAAASFRDMKSSAATAELKSAAGNNLERVKKTADQATRWLEWLILAGGTVLFFCQAAILTRAIRAIPCRGRSGTLKVVVGVLAGLAAAVVLLFAFHDPFRSLLWVAVAAGVDVVAILWMWRGPTSRAEVLRPAYASRPG